MARIKHPREPLYYRDTVYGTSPWVSVGYKTWRIDDEWIRLFAQDYPDGRNWEFFGEMIEVWPSREEDNG